MQDALIGLGSNLGNRIGSLRAAVRELARNGRITASSSVYESAPVGFLDQPDFLNAVVRLRTELDAPALMRSLLAIEEGAGRVRTGKNAPRILDLDLLYHGDCILVTPELHLPHPRRLERAFVLGPLAECAPDFRDPVTDRTLAELWEERRNTLDPIVAVAPPLGPLEAT